MMWSAAETYGLPRAGLCAGHEVATLQDDGYGIFLDWGGASVLAPLYVAAGCLKEATFIKTGAGRLQLELRN